MPEMPRAPKLISNLIYADSNAAVDWLCRAFGFTLHFAAKDDAGTILHAELRFGDDLLYVANAKPNDKYGLAAPSTFQGQSQCVCAAMEDVNAHYAHAIACGAKIITEIADTEWGARLYTCADPQGHIWTFGNYWGQPFTN